MGEKSPRRSALPKRRRAEHQKDWREKREREKKKALLVSECRKLTVCWEKKEKKRHSKPFVLGVRVRFCSFCALDFDSTMRFRIVFAALVALATVGSQLPGEEGV